MSFCERLKVAREDIGYTKTNLAKFLGYGVSTVSEYERGNNKPSLDTFIQICKLLKRDANYFLQDDIIGISPKLNPEDQYIIDNYKALTPHDKEIVDHIFKMEPEEQPKIYRFPVFYQSAAAGVGRLDVSNGYYMENFIVDNVPNEAVFIMEIAGESMYDEKSNYLIHTGSKVLIDTKIENYELNRRIVIVNFSGKTICKRYEKENNYILYKSDNEFFEKENRKSTDDPSHKIIGVVLGVIEDNKFIEIE